MPHRWQTQGFGSGEECETKMQGKVDDVGAFCYGPPSEALHPEDFKDLTLNQMKAKLKQWVKQRQDLGDVYHKTTENELKAVKLDSNIHSLKTAIGDRTLKTEALIHPDFLKIYKQFIKHCKDETEGANRYSFWVKALNLDDTKPYGDSRREQFRWVGKHANYSFWKEDGDAKYWRVEAGFPLESMNRNVYTERELELSGRTLQGQTSNLNHKYRMKPVEIVASEYEDGVVECVVRVPNSYHCPGCKRGMTFNEVLQKQLVVNVSLEASCDYTTSDIGACEGMHFTGLAFLTKDVLPGIPLTRIMPLESIMVEALQASTNRRKKRMTKKIEAKVVEQGTTTIAAPPDPHKRVKPDASGQCPEGMKLSTIAGTGEEPECVPSTDEEKETKVAGAIEPDLAETPIGTPPSPSPTILQSGPTYGHKGAPTGSATMTNEARQKILRQYEQEENPYAQCLADQKASGFNEDDSKEICKDLRPAESAGELEPKPDTPPMSWPVEEPTGKLQAGDPMPKVTGDEDPVDKAGTPKRPDISRSGTNLTPEGDSSMHPVDASTMKPDDSHGCDDLHHWDQDLMACVPNSPIVEQDTQPCPEGEHRDADGKCVPNVTEQETPGSPQCPENFHWDPELEDCVSDEPIAETVRRIKAETKVARLEKNVSVVEATWAGKYMKLNKAYTRLIGANSKQEQFFKSVISDLKQTRDRLGTSVEDLRVENRELKANFGDATRTSTKYERKVTEYKMELEQLKKKYHGALAINLELTTKNTKNNEDYIQIAKRCEHLEDQLKKSRILGKKIVKIKA